MEVILLGGGREGGVSRSNIIEKLSVSTKIDG